MRFVVTKVHLNRGGYTSSGQYFGVGAPLYEIIDNDNGESFYHRANNVKMVREWLDAEMSKHGYVRRL
jgi:hypothetical protein